ncbi:type II toxin-antitoxin system YafQ family toxin [Bifidobacterium simiarum]|uniref:Type II toxin-antitoxin system mRNA interferase toxin, RelE/StbE family n=1 Tax=Bifidobacterium simiarum TaxID=2045441 RepID=A0A2M9HD37_9BIFI|nr:type II toxin-antitoxin system YafQ family toxin [Bifidobacterium simiarum]MBT1166230.1 type II toxin-antitoxin system YafQ family toxin [Bifidobacterium simiarum]PJM74721.1 type II toxin-antitoxin system mRNA interferase toxin, RelE/StbE family [Bifidobacterium simiarum]
MRYRLKPTEKFKSDFRRLKMEHPEMIPELKEAFQELIDEGTLPSGYVPHVLGNRGGLYNGRMDAHIWEGRVDVVLVYQPHASQPSILLLRCGTHGELFQGGFHER